MFMVEKFNESPYVELKHDGVTPSEGVPIWPLAGVRAVRVCQRVLNCLKLPTTLERRGLGYCPQVRMLRTGFYYSLSLRMSASKSGLKSLTKTSILLVLFTIRTGFYAPRGGPYIPLTYI